MQNTGNKSEPVSVEIQVPLPAPGAFDKFVRQLDQWWPKEYTWSQDQLMNISIDAKVDGLCTETGPYGFRCDWGRVIEIETNASLCFKWQINSHRQPVPDPDRCSTVTITFEEKNGQTHVTLTHAGFDAHGEGARTYREAMASKSGWPYILSLYYRNCTTATGSNS